MKTDDELWEEIEQEMDAAQWNPSRRICAHCLCAVPRATYYTEHLPTHGVEVLIVSAVDSEQK